MAWTLIVLLLAVGHPAALAVDFETLDACQKARSDLEFQLEMKNYGKSYMIAICVAK